MPTNIDQTQNRSLEDRSWKSRTISKDLTISLVIVILLVSTLFSTFNFIFSTRKGKADLEQKAEEYLYYMKDSLELSLWNFDEEIIDKIGNSYINNELFASVRIVEASGKVIFEKTKNTEKDWIERSTDVLHQGKIIGSIRISLTTGPLEQKTQQLMWSNFYSTVVIIVTLVGLTGLLLRIFLNVPITELIKGIDQIAEGKYNHKFQKARQWEIIRIISRFNIMADRVRQREDSLKQVNRRLEKENEERKTAEEALKESEKRFRLLAESSSDVIWTISLEGIITYVSPSIKALAGYDPVDVIGLPFGEVLTTESRKTATDRLAQELGLPPEKRSGSATLELQQPTKNKTLIDIEVSLSWILNNKDEAVGIQAMARSITERKRAADALRRSEERLEKMNRCFLEFGADSVENINRLTTLCGELLGATCALYSRIENGMLCVTGQWQIPSDYNPVDRPVGHICYDIINMAEDKVTVITDLQQTHYARTDPNVDRYKLQTYMGRTVKLLGNSIGSLCAAYTDNFEPDEADKRMIEIISSAISVEETRMWAESARKESEEKYRSVLETSPDPIIAYDMEGKVTYLNSSFTNTFGWTLEELIDKKTDYVPTEEWPRTAEMLRRIQKGKNFSGFMTKRFTKNGSIVDINMSAANWTDSRGRLVGSVITLRDITEQKKLETHRRYTQKMEAIGRLAGGIAHDFNNILGGIFGFTQLAKINTSTNPKVQQYLDQIFAASQRAKKLVQQILTFSRQTTSEKIPCDISLAIKEALKLLQASLPATIEIRDNIKSNLGLVKADQTQIHQVLMNLCTNAFQAMKKDGGLLEVLLAPVVLEKSDVSLFQDLEPGQYMKLTVSDTGCGMEPEMIEHIFEPYFTTREAEEGTGIGLATVHGIVKEHGGTINVYSEPGAGTSFHVLLPCIEATQTEEMQTIESLPTGAESILLVDDEKSLADSGKLLLESLGYGVKSVTDPLQALEIFKDDPAKYDLIITDMTMPKMTGYQLAQEITNIRFNIPIILRTGLGKTMTLEEAARVGIKTILVKPLTLQDIAVSVREVLDKKD